MDVSATSLDAAGKKTSLEELPKEELIKKCRSLLTIAQKAKHAKDALTEENGRLKEKLRTAAATDEIIDSLTQQKLSLVTSLEELKRQRRTLDEKLAECEAQLSGSERRISELDTENQGCKRQVVRLTDENEQLLTHLDQLERQIGEIKRDAEVDELQKMLAVAFEEVKKLKSENASLVESMDRASSTIEANEKVEEELNAKLRELREEKDAEIERLKADLSKLEAIDTTIDERMMAEATIAAELQEKINELEAENARLVIESARTVGLEATIAEKNDEIEVLKVQLAREFEDKLKAEDGVLQQNIQEKETSFESAKEGLNAEIDALKVDNERLRLSIQENKDAEASLSKKLQDAEHKNLELEAETERLRASTAESAESIQIYQQKIEEKNKEIERHASLADDLNTEIHKNRAYIEKLKQDVASTNSRLNDNQIVSSGLTTDLQNTNEKMRERLRLYREKIVRFAGDVKRLRESRDYVLDSFKTYNEQVKSWKEQLTVVTKRLTTEIEEGERKRLRSEEQVVRLEAEVERLLELNAEMKRVEDERIKRDEEERTRFEQLKSEEIGGLEETKARLIGELEESKREISRVEEERSSLEGEVTKLREELKSDDIGVLQERFEEMKERLVGELEESKREKRGVEEERSKLEIEVRKLQDEVEGVRILQEQLKETKGCLAGLVEDSAREKSRGEEERSKLEGEVGKLLEEVEILREQIEASKHSEERLKAQLEEQSKLREELKLLQDRVEEMKGLEERLLEEKNRLESESRQRLKELEGTQAENEELQRKIAGLTEEVERTNGAIKKAQKEKDRMFAENDENAKLIVELKRAIERLEKDMESSKSTEGQLAEQSQQENKELKERNEALKVRIEEGDGDDRLNALRRENAELLAEMNEMNQALKERGETISKQQAYCDEVLKKIAVYESQANRNDDAIVENEKTIRSLEEENRRLTEELASLRDRQCDESDALSTSTISRADESNRLKELEGSWEERYGKLRNLALKLKGRIKELTADVSKEQAEKAELLSKLANASKTIQTTQLQCDTMQDELESCKAENKSLLKKLDALAVDISRDKKELAQQEETISALRVEVDSLAKDKAEVENWKKQIGLKVKSLKKELDANVVLKKDFEARVAKLTAELDAKERALRDEIERHQQTRSSLHESANECKKQSVLNLEMQDYERSVKELSAKLERKNELVDKLKNQLDGQKGATNVLKEQNRLLEERSTALETELDAHRVEATAYKKSVAELEATLAERDGRIVEAQKMLETARGENEELSTQLSKAMAERQRTDEALKADRERLRGETAELERRTRELDERLAMREAELDDVRREYQGYKVRAQSVLRQKEARDVGTEEKLAEEAATLRAQIEIFKNEVDELKSSMAQLSEENEALKARRIEIEAAKKVLAIDVDECRKEYEKLNAKYQQTIVEHAETVRGLKIHADTLAQCYRQQITEQESRHNREIVELQSRLDKGPSPPDVPVLVPPTTPREEGEGSESVDGSTGNGVHPLERLLGADQEHEIGLVRKQLADNESKVSHLTALLADTEQDLVKHVQMNKVLKEEIRRQQRSVEREKHAENLEYMKNVVFKFITLSSGDERQRLVPVLNTILKLSPEETHKLNLVAKGDRSWSNYLPLWTGKPQ